MEDKYIIQESDWRNMNIVDIKMKAQNILASIVVIENTMASIADPDISDKIEDFSKSMLDYIDEHFLNQHLKL